MKHMIKMAVAGLMMCANAAFAADPVFGIWQTQPDDGAMAHVKIAPCGNEICGTVIRVFKDGKETTTNTIGKRLIQDMKPVGDGQYAGKVWRPSNDKIYVGKIDLHGDSMDLRGCVVGGLICAKQVWTRLP